MSNFGMFGISVEYDFLAVSLGGRKSGNIYEITMDDAAIIGGPFGYPIEMERKFNLELL
jgi:hypothetical protein